MAPMVTVVVYQRIPRLTRQAFDKGMKRLDFRFPDIHVKPEALDSWYEAFISLPDDAFMNAINFICYHSVIDRFPNCWDIGEIATIFYPQRELEIDPVATLAERKKREMAIASIPDIGWLEE